MKKFARSMRTRFVTTIVSLVVFVALCFSVGEGLRLTPFPISALNQVETADQQLRNTTHESARYKYGPLDVPTQNQKRNKRQTVDFACPSTDVTRHVPTYLQFASNQEPTQVVPSLFISRPAGRAPPSIS